MSVHRWTLIEMIRGAPGRIYETLDLSDRGHCYLYRYDSQTGQFFRATVPAGAARPHFRLLKESDHLPLGGWVAVEVRRPLPQRPRLVPSSGRVSA